MSTTPKEQLLEEALLKLIKKDPSLITKLGVMPEVCLAAVKQDGYVIEYLTDAQRTPDVCLAAVHENGYVIEYLTEAQRTPEVCLAAVQRYGVAIYYLSESQRTPEVCLAAFQQHDQIIQLLTPDQITRMREYESQLAQESEEEPVHEQAKG